jgi:hypothetical protein
MKKSFVLHVDSLEILVELSDEQAGKLFKAIRNHQIGEENNLDLLTKMAFIPFKNQFLRDGDKWEEKRSFSGRIGNLKRWHSDLYKKFKEKEISLEEAEIIAKRRKSSQKSQNIAVSASVSVNDSVSVSVNDSVSVKEVKKKKKEKKIPPPSFEDFKNYALEKKENIDLKKLRLKYDSWIENGWKTIRPERDIKNWKSTLCGTLPYIDEVSKKENKPIGRGSELIEINKINETIYTQN